MTQTRSARLMILVQSNSRMVVNAASLVGTMGLNSALGFAFWYIAARYYTQTQIGIASASFSAMLILGELSVLGLTTYLIGEVPRHKGSVASLIYTSVVITFGTGALSGLIFALVAPLLSEDLSVLRANIGHVLLFAFGVSLTSNALVVDHAMVGLNRGEYQLWRNLFFAVLKLIFIVIMALVFEHHTSMDIFSAWILAGVVSLLVVPAIASRNGVTWQSLSFQRSLLSGLRGDIIAHHGLNLAVLGPSIFIPTLSTILISAETGANFYIAWMFTSVMLVVPYALSTSLYGAASANLETFVTRIRVTLLLSVVVGISANIVLAFVAHPILSLFGDVYADEATLILRLLAMGIFPFIAIVHYSAIARIDRTTFRAAVIMGIGAAMQVVAMIIGSRLGGATELTLGYLSALTLISLVTLPTVYRAAMGLHELPKPEAS